MQVQEQPSIIDGRTDVTPCSTTINTKESPEQCTEHSIGQPPCSDQSPNENMIINEQCAMARGLVKYY